MRSLWNLFRSSPQSQEVKHQHQNKVTHVCYQHSCKHRYVCSLPECVARHSAHESSIIPYQQFHESLMKARKQMEYRQKIEKLIQDYRNSIVRYVDSILDKSKKQLYEHIDKKFFNKQFVQMHRRYRNGQDYIPYLANLQNTTAQHIYESISKTIKDRQKRIPNFVLKEEVNLDISILPDENIREIISYSKIDAVKSLLPFKCNLTLKFKASKNKYLTQNLYNCNIRGPILLVAQSYKGKIFGGFCPATFSKNEQYIQDRKGSSFLFSLDHKVRLPIKEQYRRYAIKGGSNLWFGRGDLVIADQCHKGNISWAEIGRAYQVPPGVYGRETEFLAGAWYFRVLEYEIYEVQIESIRKQRD